MTLFTPTVELGDAVAGLNDCARGSVALVLSDLPSGATRAPTDTPPDFDRLWPAIWRALAPAGTVVLLASHFRFAAEVVASQPDAFRYDLVWEKTRATGFLNAAHQPLRAHEHTLVFYRRRGTFNPQMTEGHPPISSTAFRTGHGSNYGAEKRPGQMSRAGATDRWPRSVLRTTVVPNIGNQRRHHQEKPVVLMRWFVASYTDPGDLVVDPYAGSGSAGEAALSLGRRFRGFDTDPAFGTATERDA